jgi:hypothetical protein
VALIAKGRSGVKASTAALNPRFQVPETAPFGPVRVTERLLLEIGSLKDRTRRAELSEFIKTTTTAITKREVAFRSALNQSQPTNCDNISTLKELNKLKESGAITEAEYLAKKEELLRKIG